MLTKRSVLVFCFLYFGCAAYKQLKPDPEISFSENGYIEIADDEDKFELAAGKKYFIRFPQPQYENTYIVLTINNKPLLHSYLTRAFDDGKGEIITMEDVSAQPLKMSVYQVDPAVPVYYWVIDTVRQDMVMGMQYRYIAIWRFKFEQKKEEYESILSQNRHKRTIYDSIGVSLPARDIPYAAEQETLQKQIPQMEELHSRLKEIEAIFPEHILNSSDESYLAYLSLQKELETEILFQKKYQTALTALASLSDSRQTMASFVEHTSEYNSLLGDSLSYRANIMMESRKLVAARLVDLPAYLDSELQQKKNIEPIPLDMQGIQQLYVLSGQIIPETIFRIDKFVSAFNKKNREIGDCHTELNTLLKKVQNSSSWPGNSYFTDRRVELAAIRSRIPATGLDPYGEYHSLKCVSQLHKDIMDFRTTLAETDAGYRRAEELVAQINSYREQMLYREIIRLLRSNSELLFLAARYPDIDLLSLNQQRSRIDEAMNQQQWENAENSIESLFHDTFFVNAQKTEPIKNAMVKSCEDSLRSVVETRSLENANRLIEANISAFERVDTLYSGSALYPLYKPKFTSGSSTTELERKNREFEVKMTYLRTDKFPSAAIPVLYGEFSQDPQDNGVLKARAIVIHGKNYQGQDTKIKNLVAECDPTAAKWITKPTAYRKIYVLPTTNSRSGTNEYLLRLNLQIPSEAQFPVFDVNVKLPAEIARQAGSSSWYSEINFNKNILKNEGRFSITAPTAENGYEVQITPLQVNKTGNNILEIRFDFNAFKVFEVSVMAQKPIMKKN
jgi:hypothetical protein